MLELPPLLQPHSEIPRVTSRKHIPRNDRIGSSYESFDRSRLNESRNASSSRLRARFWAGLPVLTPLEMLSISERVAELKYATLELNIGSLRATPRLPFDQLQPDLQSTPQQDCRSRIGDGNRPSTIGIATLPKTGDALY